MKHLLIGVFAAIALIGSKVALETTAIGHLAEAQTYGLLIRLLPTFTKEGPPVQVLDVSHLIGRVGEDGQKLIPTHRERLFDLLTVIAEQRPLAIGVDVDFSPTQKGWVSEQDPDFFERCQALAKKYDTPIFLGIYRTLREQPEAWLGVSQFQSMAAGLWLPRSAEPRLPVAFAPMRAGKTPSTGSEGDAEQWIPSLGAALAGAVLGTAKGPPLIPPSAVELESLQLIPINFGGATLQVRNTMVDYSFLDQIERESLRKVTPADVRKNADRIRNHVVLLGDTSREAGDRFPVPVGEEDRNGVFVHAALATSLVAHPLYEFKHSVRLAFDAALSFIVIALVLVLSGRGAGAAEHAIEARVVSYVVIAVLLLGVTFVLTFRVVWLDFLLVVFFLAVHPTIETRLKRILSRLRSTRIGAA
ncbi:hypothetical protein ASC95_08690 [Pelomonas sp. Root1217]|uniref:CHASE2 domain-containing protein n=1 Tax=Pelomonas sp. Root1217 TaxID=1736430 RepID=UPI00070A6F36|nr:CHASE2 domain-containing protein [Pelomonas sp. Root1217]KQV52866.1 hypothetical protein ASC95_08690 [Pelomonas sp. Root1217]